MITRKNEVKNGKNAFGGDIVRASMRTRRSREKKRENKQKRTREEAKRNERTSIIRTRASIEERRTRTGKQRCPATEQ